jgi:D-alanyl-D-alanine carboxypeptidase
VDGATGALLYGKNPHGRVAPASVTKIATAIVALEHARPDERVAISVDARLMPESTVMGLEPGENLSLLTLLYGLMLPSGNDAALAIAQHVGGGSVERFVQMMNDKARALGLENTHFANPHGLDAPDHYSSPFDMVQFARYGMRNAEFAQLAAAKSWAGEGYRLSNLNRLLWSYPGADGVKVGYTDEAGKTIVATATRDGHRVYVGLMRSLDLVSDCTLLLDYAFENFTW